MQNSPKVNRTSFFVGIWVSVLFVLFVLVIWFIGIKYIWRPAPPPVVVVAPQSPTNVQFNGPNVVEFEDGKCWIIVNMKKKSVYRHCG